ncbi:MAG: DUF1501 domain-containing protein [Planctomycetaceae bacterium]
MAGGPSQIDTYDPKPEQPEEIRGPFSTIATSVPGMSVTDYLPRHVSIADKLAVIRSIHAVGRNGRSSPPFPPRAKKPGSSGSQGGEGLQLLPGAIADRNRRNIKRRYTE